MNKDSVNPDTISASPFAALYPGRFRWILILAGLLLTTLLCYLLYYNYRHMVIIEQNQQLKKLSTLDGQMKFISYFILERENDIQDLAHSSFVKAYFANQSIGMSELYGLNQSRNLILKQLRTFNSSIHRKNNGLYSRIAVFAADGSIVTDMVKGSLSPTSFKDTVEFAAGFPKALQIRLTISKPGYLLIVMPVGDLEGPHGYVAGWVELDKVYEHFLNGPVLGTTQGNSFLDTFILCIGSQYFIFEKKYVSVYREAIDQVVSGLISSISPQDKISQRHLGYKKVVADTGQTLSFFSSSEPDKLLQLIRLTGAIQSSAINSSLKNLIFLSLSSFLVLFFFYLVIRARIKVRIFESRLQGVKEKHEESLEINKLLNAEIILRENVETDLENERLFLQNLVSAIPDLIFFKRLDGSLQHRNKAFDQFCGIDILLTEPLEDCHFYMQAATEYFNKDDEQVLVNGLTIEFEQWVKSYAGADLFFNVKKSPCYSIDGTIIGLVCVCRDRTSSKFIEIELKKSYERFEMVLWATNTGLWDWIVPTGELVLNERWADIVGYTLEELSPITINTWTDLVHPDDGILSDLLLNKHICHETADYSCEIRMRHKSGRWVWVLDQGRIVQWTDDGKPYRMSGSHVDITQRKEMEQCLRDSELNFRTLFESIGDMIFVGDMSGRIVYSNSAAQQNLEYTDLELRGMGILDLHAPHQRGEAQDILAAMLRGEQKSCPLPLYTHGLKSRPVETRVWLGKWNGTDAIYGISKDLTKQQEALQKFERLFRNNPALMALSSVEGQHFIDVNETFLKTLGFSYEEIRGATAADHNLFVDKEKAAETMNSLLKEGGVDNVELQVRCKNGEIIDGMFSGEIIESQGEKHFLSVMINSTALKDAQKQLLDANESLEKRVRERTRTIEEMHEKMIMQDKMAAIGALAAGIAHEMNNPFNFVNTNFVVLRGYFSNLRELIDSYRHVVNTEVNNEQYSNLRALEAKLRLDYILKDIPELFKESQHGYNRIAKIISSMRNFSYSDQSGKFVKYDLNIGIEETLIIAKNIYKYHAKVIKDLGQITAVCCLPQLLKQVFLNLVVNSAQAIETQNSCDLGTITIRTWMEEDEIICEFSDDGPSIPPKIRSRIFEPFFTTKLPGQGIGLGLSNCYDIIVNKHKGELCVDCPDSGGTVFIIRLPMNSECKRNFGDFSLDAP